MEDKAKGYGLGADDYLTKPFEQLELQLKIKALLRRRLGDSDAKEDEVKEIGKYKLDTSSYTLLGGKEERRLTRTEAKVLEALLQQKGKVIERDFILNLVWGKDDYHTGRSLDVYISKLRKYLSEDDSLHIENIHGVGFRIFEDEK
jgi:DNA-binding response OmpR family regulator